MFMHSYLDVSNGVATNLQWLFPPDIAERMQVKDDPTKTTRTVLEWLKTGSLLEDELLEHLRSSHHFHDPYRNAGLDNKIDHPNWRAYAPVWGTWWNWDLTGESALNWAKWQIDVEGTKEPKTNEHSWHYARDSFYIALTNPVKSLRDEYLTITFFDLGHVLHMIEDMGVPAHTRNDFLFAHYRGIRFEPTKIIPDVKGDYLERWVERRLIDYWHGFSHIVPSIPEEWLVGWTPQPKVFTKLAHYWDTGAYMGQYVGDDVMASFPVYFCKDGNGNWKIYCF